MKTYVKIALSVVSFIAISAILAAIYLYNLKHTDMSKAKPDYVISASLLLKAFEDDEAEASNKYINMILEVHGTISTIKAAENNVLNIFLKTENPFSSVICTLPAINDPSLFHVGDEIILRGECSGFLMDVLLNNCVVIK